VTQEEIFQGEIHGRLEGLARDGGQGAQRVFMVGEVWFPRVWDLVRPLP